jgi:hypothetical protein
MPPGIDVQVSPASLAVGPGESATYDVTFTYVSGPLDFYRFGSITWVSSDHAVRSVLSIRPLSVAAPGDIIAFGGSGSVTFPVDFGYTGTYSPGVHGLNLPLVIDGFVDDDPDKTPHHRRRYRTCDRCACRSTVPAIRDIRCTHRWR